MKPREKLRHEIIKVLDHLTDFDGDNKVVTMGDIADDILNRIMPLIPEDNATMRPFRPISPGEILKEELRARGWNAKILADIIRRPPEYVQKIIDAEKIITKLDAHIIAKALGTSPVLWMRLRKAYELDIEFHKR